jgi:hypothetical protein
VGSLSPKKIAVSLLFTNQAKNIVLSWASALTNYMLEGTTNLNPPSWSLLTHTPQLNGEQQSITIVPKPGVGRRLDVDSAPGRTLQRASGGERRF